ncbi:hypothetical protein BDA96_05G240400 [Sorghum bicolor]|uniref:Uncharacterized protein n=1 Tax=Sorghum bicolor TaxID=4558 RepID=A0A921QZ74_SORBI|nr:hypothetical protein BDA96_05G240400 [Sorghum bicolor]
MPYHDEGSLPPLPPPPLREQTPTSKKERWRPSRYRRRNRKKKKKDFGATTRIPCAHRIHPSSTRGALPYNGSELYSYCIERGFGSKHQRRRRKDGGRAATDGEIGRRRRRILARQQESRARTGSTHCRLAERCRTMVLE